MSSQSRYGIGCFSLDRNVMRNTCGCSYLVLLAEFLTKNMERRKGGETSSLYSSDHS